MQYKSKVRMKTLGQTGVVSIITVVLLAMVLTLITTAFVKSANSNQRQALDNQLSTQALYAAETGVNDATSIIKNNLANPATDMNTENCATFLNVIQTNTNLLGNNPDKLDSSSNIQYTCVLVNNRTPNVTVNIETGQGRIYPIKSADNSVIDKLSFTWGQDQNTTTFLDSQLPDQTTWGNDDRKALIRLTFYFAATFNRNDLIANQKTFFLKPIASGGLNIFDSSTTEDGAVVQVACNSSNACNLDITNVNTMTGINAANNRPFYVRIEPIYNESTVTITAYSGIQRQDLAGAQYSIDVTGRANDVYRRIEVRRPIMTNWDFPDATVQAGSDLCKQFVAYPGSATDDPVSNCSF